MTRIITRLAAFMALLGGAVLLGLIVLTVISVIGRGGSPYVDWMKPVTGDFELIEAGIAFAVFAFLPLCQLTRAHAFVDVLTLGLPGRVTRALDWMWEVVLTATTLLLTWQLWIGTGAMMRNGQETYLLQFPIWWAYAASLAAAVVACVVAIACTALRLTGHLPRGHAA